MALSLLGSRRAGAVATPAVTITPAGSIEALNRTHRLATEQSSDDESTPLMSELSSPSHSNAPNNNNAGFGSPTTSDFSPSSIKSTPTEGPQDYSKYPLYNECEAEIKMSSRLLSSLSRQDAFDKEEEAQSSRDDPETTV